MKKKFSSSIRSYRALSFKNQNGLCFYCNQPMWTKNLKEFCQLYRVTEDSAQLLKCTAEHIVARQDGGTNQRTNIVAACLFCNRTRHQEKNALSAEKYKVKVSNLMSKNKWHPIHIN